MTSEDGTTVPRVDADRTRAARAGWTRGGAAACGCASCSRWLDARADLWPADLDAWLDERGIGDGFESAVDALDDEDGGGWALVFHALPIGGAGDASAAEAGASDVAEPGSSEDVARPDPGPLPDGVAAATWRVGSDRAPIGWPEDGLELTVRLAAE